MTSAINAGYTSSLYMNFLHQQFNEIIHFSYRYLIDYVMKNKLISISNNAIDKHNNCCIKYDRHLDSRLLECLFNNLQFNLMI